MAGFQKYPVPRWQFYHPWAYNKRWKQQTAMVFCGSLLWTMILGRYFTMKQVSLF